ncbi:sugar transferase [uncultured Sphingomonas sp.]|uniref:sugar transferase n=1 Tax=uncultured Sphingomonas sp. TaxID=158754 RepID=UPI0025E7EF05|nr:sugar transferase [uncultured Sphingomonas sp.]
MNQSDTTHMPTSPARLRPSDIQAMRVRIALFILISDCVAVLIGCVAGNMVRFGDPLASPGLNLFALVLPLFVGLAINSDAYAADVLRDVRAGLSRAMLAYVFAIFAVFFLAFYMKASADLSRINSLVAMGVTAAAMGTGRYVCLLYTRRMTGMQLVYDLLITDGVAVKAPPHVHVLDAERDDLRPNLQDPHMLNRLGMHLRGVDRVVIACPPGRRQVWSMLLKGSSVNGHIVAEELDEVGAIGIGLFAGKHTLAVAHAPLDLSRRAAKRALDLSLTIPGLIFLAPLLIVVAIAIKFDSRGPIFFLQPRVGRGNRIFLTYKFRSMRAELSDAAGNRSTARDDNRVTRVGRFIRATSIDELPQLFNVLRGEMSLVGPRPHALGSLAGNELFWEVDERYWHRHASKPGVTGLAQVRGYRGATPEREDLANRLRADLEYLNGWTIWRDISILINTLRVLVHRNAY